MLRIAIADIINTSAKEKSVKGKVEHLQKHDTIPLRQVLRLIYDEDIEFLVPDSKPPFKENELVDLETLLYREARRLTNIL